MQQSSTVPYVFICNLFPRRDVAHLAVREPSPFTSRFRCVARWHLKATTFASYIFRMSTHVDLTEADFYSRFPCVMHAYMSVCAHYGQMRTAVPKTSTTGTVNTTTTEWSVSWTQPPPPPDPAAGGWLSLATAIETAHADKNRTSTPCICSGVGFFKHFSVFQWCQPDEFGTKKSQINHT